MEHETPEQPPLDLAEDAFEEFQTMTADLSRSDYRASVEELMSLLQTALRGLDDDERMGG